jgi:hypothetical protein
VDCIHGFELEKTTTGNNHIGEIGLGEVPVHNSDGCLEFDSGNSLTDNSKTGSYLFEIES